MHVYLYVFTISLLHSDLSESFCSIEICVQVSVGEDSADETDNEVDQDNDGYLSAIETSNRPPRFLSSSKHATSAYITNALTTAALLRSAERALDA